MTSIEKIFFLSIAILFASMPFQANSQVVIQSTQGVTYTEPAPPKPPKPHFRPQGPFLQLSALNPSAVVFGYQITHSFMVAIGAGYNPLAARKGEDEHLIPLFIETRLGTPLYSFSLFVDARVGIDLNQISNGIEFTPVFLPSIGMQFYNFGLGVGVNLFKDYEKKNDYFRSFIGISPAVYLEYRIPLKNIMK